MNPDIFGFPAPSTTTYYMFIAFVMRYRFWIRHVIPFSEYDFKPSSIPSIDDYRIGKDFSRESFLDDFHLIAIQV